MTFLLSLSFFMLLLFLKGLNLVESPTSKKKEVACLEILRGRHRDLMSNSIIRFCYQLFTKQGIISGHGESKIFCLNLCLYRFAQKQTKKVILKMQRFEPGTSCITDMSSNHYTMTA